LEASTHLEFVSTTVIQTSREPFNTMHFGERDLEMRELNGNMMVGGLEADGEIRAEHNVI